MLNINKSRRAQFLLARAETEAYRSAVLSTTSLASLRNLFYR